MIGFKSYATDTVIRGNTVIGRYCSIGERCTIGAFMHPVDWLTTHPIGYREIANFGRLPERNTKETIIGNDVWIGDNVVVLQGVSIGDGAIIGAGAVVTKDVPPYCIYAGIPAKELRKRFPEDVVKKLLGICWWNYGPDILLGLPIWNTASSIEEIEKAIASGKHNKLQPHHNVYKRKKLTKRRRRFLGFKLPF